MTEWDVRHYIIQPVEFHDSFRPLHNVRTRVDAQYVPFGANSARKGRGQLASTAAEVEDALAGLRREEVHDGAGESGRVHEAGGFSV